MEYVYKTDIFRNTENLIGFNIVQNNLDLADFESNGKSSCIEITAIDFAETTIRTDKTYTQFKALITGDLAWSDVRLIILSNKYELYLITSYPI